MLFSGQMVGYSQIQIADRSVNFRHNQRRESGPNKSARSVVLRIRRFCAYQIHGGNGQRMRFFVQQKIQNSQRKNRCYLQRSFRTRLRFAKKSVFSKELFDRWRLVC